MWRIQTKIIEKDQVVQYQILHSDKAIRFRELLKLWQQDRQFVLFFVKKLAQAPFSAYFWEMPALQWNNLDNPVEFVLIKSPQLVNVKADPSDFKSYFKNRNQSTVSFSNLGGDARLLVPSPQDTDAHYAHIATFVRHAPEPQQIELFQQLGSMIEEHLSYKPLWVSTSGLGVYWLHIRLDARPKYYQYEPYKKA